MTKCTLGSSIKIQRSMVDGCTIELCTWKSGKIIKARKSLDCVKEQKEWAVEWAREQISLYVAMWTALVLEFMFLCIDPYVYTPTCKSAQAYAGRCHRTMEKPSLAYNNISLLYLIPDKPVTKISSFLRQFFTYYHNIFANR